MMSQIQNFKIFNQIPDPNVPVSFHLNFVFFKLVHDFDIQISNFQFL